LNDDGTLGGNALNVVRTGSGITQVNIPAFTADGGGTIDGALTVAGDAFVKTMVYAGASSPPTPTAGLDSGLGLVNAATTATGDPTFGSVNWSFGNEWFYRSGAANEGNGKNNRVHNATVQSVAVGSAYNLTTSYAQIANGVSAEVLLPTPGTYLLLATVTVDADVTTGNDRIYTKLFNSSDSLSVANSERMVSNIPNNKRGQVITQCVYAITGSNKTIQLYGKNQDAARGTVFADQTTLAFVRLY
jgi:hypothetical protein